jgi:predicted N-acetyltransferase YhbS
LGIIVTNDSLPQALVVRIIALEDAVAVAELCGQLGYPASGAEIAERIKALLTRIEDQVAFVACLGGEVVGWIEASIVHHLQSAPHALIGGLVVKDGVRSLGVGRRLCAEVEEWSREKGMAVLRVTSRTTREDAHLFYLRSGFRQTKTSAMFEKVLS